MVPGRLVEHGKMPYVSSHCEAALASPDSVGRAAPASNPDEREFHHAIAG